MRKLHEYLREAFLGLTEFTVPAGHEDRLRPWLPEGAVRDEHGNYAFDVGEHKGVMFSSHLDTVGMTVEKVHHRYLRDGRIGTNKQTILGADCKTGVAIMLAMIRHGVPGHYVFHAGEEVGGKGSHARAASMAEFYRNNIRMCVALDRRGYGSIITRQGGTETCSSEFAKSVAEAMKFGREDPTGSFTDSKSYAHLIPECTNLSVGYFNQHGMDEWQSVPYMHQLLNQMIQVDWSRLTVARVAKEEYTHGNYHSRGYVSTNVSETHGRKLATRKVEGATPARPSAGETNLWVQRRLIREATQLGPRVVLPKSSTSTACFFTKKRLVETLFKTAEGRKSYMADNWFEAYGKSVRRLDQVEYGGIAYDPHDDALFLVPDFQLVYWDIPTQQLIVLENDRHIPTLYRDIRDERIQL